MSYRNGVRQNFGSSSFGSVTLESSHNLLKLPFENDAQKLEALQF